MERVSNWEGWTRVAREVEVNWGETVAPRRTRGPIDNNSFGASVWRVTNLFALPMDR